MEQVDLDPEESRQYVTFQNGDRYYGIEILNVREIRQWSATAELPNQPSHTRGVLNIRGEVIPVHDLRARFGEPMSEADENHVIVIVAIAGQNVGIVVDAVSDIVDVASSEIKPVPPGARGGSGEEAIAGLVEKDETMLSLINLERLFPSSPALAA